MTVLFYLQRVVGGHLPEDATFTSEIHGLHMRNERLETDGPRVRDPRLKVTLSANSLSEFRGTTSAWFPH
jgi:hypothetical protein